SITGSAPESAGDGGGAVTRPPDLASASTILSLPWGSFVPLRRRECTGRRQDRVNSRPRAPEARGTMPRMVNGRRPRPALAVRTGPPLAAPGRAPDSPLGSADRPASQD